MASMTSRPIAAVGFDADDTLWHNEDQFQEVEGLFVAAVAPFASESEAHQALFETESANLALLGYGAKAFTISMIEAAVRLSNGAIASLALQRLVEGGKSILSRPVELLDGVAEVITATAARCPIVLITKGDLLHQERKIVESGLAAQFAGVHVVNEKDVATYARILRDHAIDPASFVMVGNSVRSDLIPVLELGGRGVHVPYHVTWAHENAAAEAPYVEIARLTELPAVLDAMTS